MEATEVKTGRTIPWGARYLLNVLVLLSSIVFLCNGQDYGTPGEDGGGGGGVKPTPEMADCNGVFMSYNFGSRERGYPHVKNVTAQSWGFKASAMVVNTGKEELKGWQMFIGFRHRELIVSATGAAPMDGDFPLDASNGTTFIGSPNTDLKTSVETAGDFTQMSTNIEITGTLFGVAKGVTPMPRTIKLTNDGWECPAAKRKGYR